MIHTLVGKDVQGTYRTICIVHCMYCCKKCQRSCLFLRRLLDCENHICERVCHEGPCKSCALLPDHVTHCPCGSTPLMELLTSERTSCLDPIPTCTSLCGKLLPCSTPGTVFVRLT